MSLCFFLLLFPNDNYVLIPSCSGLCNIVIWGYAENGVGVFVGNLATLRPLFRKMLSLGGTDDSSKPTGYGASGMGLPSKQHHPYQSFENYEMRSGGSGVNGDQVTATTNTRTCKIRGGSRSRDSLDGGSDAESQKKILGSSSKKGIMSPGIVVSRQVDVSR